MERPIDPRNVKPRKASRQWRNIIVVDTETVLLENTGEILPRTQLEEIIICERPSLVVAHNVNVVVRELDEAFRDIPQWNFKATPVEREIWKPNRGSRITTTDTVIGWFGFKGRIHYPLDPLVFSRSTVHDIIPGDQHTSMKLLEWASQVREWLIRQGISLKTTQGGVAGTLLRDPRFYPAARRKVPAATNERARPKLPGNYYRLHTAPWIQHQAAVYLDQVRAHHSAARDLAFPCANSLYAKGRFHDPENATKWHARAGTSFFDRLIQEPGLFCLDVINPGAINPDHHPLPIQERPGRTRVFAYSNELEYMRAGGTIIEGIVAAWTSTKAENGLNTYARWSMEELDANPDKAGWLKPCLLSTYGVLASTPRRAQIGFRRSLQGEVRQWPVGGALLDVHVRATTKAREAAIANVIHRGMIEAETRLRSLQMARYMIDHGFRVLAVYADSVFVSGDDRTLPFLPDGWKVESALTRLQFVNDVSFVSDEVTKLPGIDRHEQDRLAVKYRGMVGRK